MYTSWQQLLHANTTLLVYNNPRLIQWMNFYALGYKTSIYEIYTTIVWDTIYYTHNMNQSWNTLDTVHLHTL